MEFDDGSARNRHRLACFESLTFIFSSCADNDVFIPRPVAEEMLRACGRYLVHYNWLTRKAEADMRLDYSPAFKNHFLWHIVFHARFQNPKIGWFFQFEDFVGTVIRCARGCMHGTPLSLVGRKVLENFLLLTQVNLRD